MCWCFKKSTGNSRGLLCIWNLNSFVLLEQFDSNEYLGVRGFWGSNQVPCLIINIYSPCNLNDRRVLGEELRCLRIDNLTLAWCIMGDFNAVRCPSERIDRLAGLVSREIEEFDEFIEDMGLIDLPLIGRKYTWHRANGTSSSRIDRFLLSEEWISLW